MKNRMCVTAVFVAIAATARGTAVFRQTTADDPAENSRGPSRDQAERRGTGAYTHVDGRKRPRPDSLASAVFAAALNRVADVRIALGNAIKPTNTC